MSFQIRYAAGTALGNRFPNTRYPWSRPAYETRDLAEEIRDQMVSRDQLEIVEVET